ncbi:MAG: PAS domain S-box protein [Bacteroidia bacterium]|nr:PAS domain S-box protein [Bacteroidia bacterium]MDW8159563.1 PAS domain S-box protein [Bacteroidia bacterium]
MKRIGAYHKNRGLSQIKPLNYCTFPSACLYHSKNNLSFLEIIAKESPYVFYVRDIIQNRIVYVNQAVFTIYGYDIKELYELDAQELLAKFHPEDLPKVHKHFENFKELNQNTFFETTPELEVRIQNKEGNYIWTHIVEKPYVWDKNNIQVMGIARDISEKKVAEKLLYKKDKLQEAVANSLNILLTIENFERAIRLALACIGIAAEVDRVYVYNLGYFSSSLDKQFFEWRKEGYDYFSEHPSVNFIDIAKNFPSWFEELKKGNMIMGKVRDLDSQDRTLFQVNSVKSYLIIPILRQGELKGYVGYDDCSEERNWDQTEITTLATLAAGLGSFFDQHHQKMLKEMAYEELRISESEIRQQAINLIKLQAKLKDIAEFNKNLFESSKNGLGVLSQGKVTDINKAALQLFGCTQREEMLGMHLSSFFPKFQPNSQLSTALFENYIQEALSKGNALFEFICLRNKHGTWAAEFHLMKFTYKGMPMIQFSVRDITQEKKTLEEIHTKNIALQQQEAELKSTVADLITAKIKLKDALDLAEKQKSEIHALINSLEDITFAVDANFNFLYANDALKKLFPPDTFSQPVSALRQISLLFEEEWPAIKNCITKAFKGEVLNIEMRHHYKQQGQIKYYQMSFCPIRNDSGNIFGVVVIAKDITKLKLVQHEIEQKNLELEKQRLQLKKTIEELRIAENIAKEQRNQIYSIINSTEDIIIALDKHFTITHYNNAFVNLMQKIGIEIGPTIELKNIVTPRYWKLIEKICNQVLQGKNIIKQTKFAIYGTVYRFHQTVNPIRDSNNNVVGIVSIAKDITKLKQAQLEVQKKNKALRLQKKELKEALERLKSAQAQLVHAEKMSSLGILTAGIAHEINNPINYVNGGIEALKENLDLMLEIIDDYSRISTADQNIQAVLQAIEKKKEAYCFANIREMLPKLVEQIKIGSSRTAEIVRGLRYFSRLDEAAMKIVNIHEGIDSCLLLLNSRIKDKIEVIRNYDPDLPLIECYAGQLNQVFMNILSNAIDAIAGKGEIIITTQKINSHSIQVDFQDTGCGMPPEIVKRIFEPFFTTKEIGKGTGLGLSISYGIIKNHNGEIIVNSTPGKGSIFTLILPIELKKRNGKSREI